MNIDEILGEQYIDWKVKPVMHIEGKYGFRIVLKMSDGNEKIKQKSGFKTKTEANKERNNVIADLTNGTYIINTKIKVGPFMLFWLEKAKKPNITNDSYVAYSNAINKYIIPVLGNMYLTSINRKNIKSVYKFASKSTTTGIRLIETVLKTSLDYAVHKKLLIKNPTSNVSKKDKKKNTWIVNVDSTKTLSLEQVKILVKASENTRIHMQVIFAVLMGLRRGEINGLKYEDIDYTHKTLKIQRQLGVKANSNKKDFAPKTYTKQEIPTKTESSNRELIIPDYVFEEILKEKEKYNKNKKRYQNKKQYGFQDLGYICCSNLGRPRSRSYASTHFKQLLKDNNLPDIKWHDLRRTYCTLLLKNDFSPKAVSKMMGHSKELITVDIYGDNKEIIEDCLEELEPYIDEVIPKKKEYDFSEEVDYIIALEDYIKDLKILHEFCKIAI